MKTTQLQRLARLLQRKTGATALEIIVTVGAVCPHKRLAELKERGWIINRQPVPGERYGRYFGKPALKDKK